MKRDDVGGRTEEEQLIEVLLKLKEKDPGAFFHIIKDEETSELQNLFVQTSHMRHNVSRFGKIILFDHTYQINKNKMPVALLMVMDGNGDGRVAGIAFLSNERKENVGNTLRGFIEACGEETVKGIRTVCIDKDMSELAALKLLLPHVCVQLCDFHVVNVFNGRTAHESDEVKRIVDKLRFAETDEKFQKLCTDLEKVASKKFYDYFKDNWMVCPAAWAFNDKKNSINLGNTTTNRLESFNGKIKLVSKCEP